MKNPVRLFLAAVALFPFALAQAQTASATKPGYNVVLEITYKEDGTPDEAKIFQSDDPTGEHQLEQMALNLAAQDKQQPRLVNGKAVPFKARRPFNFPVEDDQGPAANENRPVLRAGHQAEPVYPPALAAQDVVGGAIVELTILADGTVKGVHTLRASHPEFAQAAESALAQWTFVPREGPGMPAESHWRAAVGFTTRGRNVELKWRLAPRPSLGSFIIGQRPPPGETAPAAPAPVATPAPGK